MIKISKTEIKEPVSDNTNKTDSKPWYKRWHILLAIIIFISVMIFNYNYAFILISGDSMNPNYSDGNIVFANKHFDNLYRFDVVVINADNADQIIIKRIIGLPGDTIEYRNNELYVNNEFVEDIYGSGDTLNFSYVVEENSYFCLGDNREHSNDSRLYGTFEEDEIMAKVKGRRYVKLNTTNQF